MRPDHWLFVRLTRHLFPERPDITPDERWGILINAREKAFRARPHLLNAGFGVMIVAVVWVVPYLARTFGLLGADPYGLSTVAGGVASVCAYHVATAWVARPHVAAELRARGRCERCAYDLRATPGRCPECGAVPKGAAA